MQLNVIISVFVFWLNELSRSLEVCAEHKTFDAFTLSYIYTLLFMCSAICVPY